jgi:hypothetical protein
MRLVRSPCCLSVRPPVCPSVCVSPQFLRLVRSSCCLSVYSSVSVHPPMSVHLSILLSFWGLWDHLAVSLCIRPCLCVRLCLSICLSPSVFEACEITLLSLCVFVRVCASAYVCPSVCVSPQFLMLVRSPCCLFFCNSKFLLGCLWDHVAVCMSVPPLIFYYAVRIVSKESRRIVVPTISCWFCISRSAWCSFITQFC